VSLLPTKLHQRLLRTDFNPQRTPLLVIGIAAIAGIALADKSLWLAGTILLLILTLAALILRIRRRSASLILAGCVLVAALFGWRHQARLDGIGSFPLATTLAGGQGVEISGSGWIADTVVSGDRTISTMLHLSTVQVGAHEVSTSHRVPCLILGHPGEISYGSRIRFTGRLSGLEGPRTPGGFDARAFYFRQSGSLARLEIREGDSLTLLPGREGSGIVRFAGSLRKKMEAGLFTGTSKEDEPYVRLIAAMALGARESSPEELEELFRLSGTLHLFAVSGMHVGIVAGLLVGLASLLGLPRHSAVIIVIPLVLFYAVLTGLSPSAVRAALMFSAFLAAYALRERPVLLNSLGLAGLMILAYDTQQLFLPGFQLSFAVLLFIALFASGLRTLLERPFLSDPFVPKSLLKPTRLFLDRASGAIAASLAISLTSWLGSAGLLAWHFQNLSVVGIMANVFMVPLAGIIIALASLSLSAYGLHLIWITILTNHVNTAMAMALTGLASIFAALPGASLNTGQIGTLRPDPRLLRLDIMGDRGEGAILITIPGEPGKPPLFWMIDCGGTRTYRSQVLPLLRSRGINHLDALILTHGDSGHTGAAPALLSSFRPPLLLESAAGNRSPVQPEILAAAEKLGIRAVAMDRGHRLVIGSSTVCTILSPSGTNPGRLADDRSLVLKLQYADQTILFTSDAGFDTENELIESGSDLRADLWIRGQHTESPSVLPAFLEAVNPSAVISTHSEFPKSEQIPENLRKLLQDKQIPLFDLATSGTISVDVGKGTLEIIPFSPPEKKVRIGPQAGESP